MSNESQFMARAARLDGSALAGGLAPASPSARYVLPQYEERTAYGYKRQDPYTKLFEDRIIFLGVQIDDASANGVALDLGTLFVTPFNGLRLGASISNFGTKMQIGGPLVPIDIDEGQAGNNESVTAVISTDEFDMPLTMRVGLATGHGQVHRVDHDGARCSEPRAVRLRRATAGREIDEAWCWPLYSVSVTGSPPASGGSW